MIQELKKAIITSISDVLETMFFMVIEFDESETVEKSKIFDIQKAYGCFLKFRGPFSGKFIIFIPEDLLVEMAMDFMGEESENITWQHTEGTIKEVINMVAGNTFGHYDDTIEFNIGIPELIKKEDIKDVYNSDREEGLFFRVNTGKREIVLKIAIDK